ncbi:hypothetical protein BpHYR1_042770 [Brachionus plicatilis]|uniref:Uncharacterized protein n=1 Tax=Brachionus plicatilis TaxID=10195 RepID=A0A3M7SCE3_BRAPC|nr:hypothetical protein BpHYR1_042770 [Brachionus plicatilis]
MINFCQIKIDGCILLGIPYYINTIATDRILEITTESLFYLSNKELYRKTNYRFPFREAVTNF